MVPASQTAQILNYWYLARAAEIGNGTHNRHYVWPALPVDQNYFDDEHDEGWSEDHQIPTALWLETLCKRNKEFKLENSRFICPLLIQEMGVYCILSGKYFTHVLPTNAGILHLTGHECMLSKYFAIHEIIIVYVCLEGKQQENNNGQNYSCLRLFKYLSIMVTDNCNFALLYTRL